MKNTTFNELKNKIEGKKTNKSFADILSEKFTGAKALFEKNKGKLKDNATRVACGALAVVTAATAGATIKKYVQDKNLNTPLSAHAQIYGTTIPSEVGVNGMIADLGETSTTSTSRYTITTTTEPSTTEATTITTEPSTTEATTQNTTQPTTESKTENSTDAPTTTKPYVPTTDINGEIDKSIKIMSYNIEMHYSPTVKNNPTYSWESRKPLVISDIKENDPDIICFQEITPTMNKQLKEEFGDEYTVSYFYRRNSDKSSFSTAFYFKTDRFEENDWGKFWLSETPNQESEGWGGDIRTCAYEILTDRNTGNKFCVMNTHYTLPKKSEQALVESSKLICEKTEEIGLPTIITGDFNCVQTHEAHEVLDDTFDSSQDIATEVIAGGNTYNGYKDFKYHSNNPIDFIYCTDGDWNVENYKVCRDNLDKYMDEYGKEFSEEADRPSTGSDHFAIVAEMELND